MNTAEHKEKRDLTDAQLCGYIIYWFHHFPTRTYLTTDEIFNQLSKFTTVTREKTFELLMDLAIGSAISHGGFENKAENNPYEDRWHWSLKMSEEDGKMPQHYVQLTNSIEISA